MQWNKVSRNSNDLVKLNQSKSFYDAECLRNQALVFCNGPIYFWKEPTYVLLISGNVKNTLYTEDSDFVI